MATRARRIGRARRRLWMLLMLLVKGEQRPYTLAKSLAECASDKVTRTEIETARRAVYRSLGFLERAWLVEKTPQGTIRLTPFGTIVAWRIYDSEEWFAAPLAARRIEEYYEPLRGLSVIGALTHIVGMRAEKAGPYYVREALYAIEDGEEVKIENIIFRLSLRSGEQPKLTLQDGSRGLCLSILRAARSEELLQAFDFENTYQLLSRLTEYGILFSGYEHTDAKIREAASFVECVAQGKQCSKRSYFDVLILGEEVSMFLDFQEEIEKAIERLPSKDYAAAITGISIANAFYETTRDSHVFFRAASTLIMHFPNTPRLIKLFILRQLLFETEFTIESIGEVIDVLEWTGYKREASELLERARKCIIERSCR